MKSIAVGGLLLFAVGCGPDSAGDQAKQSPEVKNTFDGSDHVKTISPPAADVSSTAFSDIDGAIHVLMTSEDNGDVGKAMAWLGAQKAAAVGPLAAIMNDAGQSPKHRNYACKALGFVGAPAADVLLAALSSDDSLIRVNAAKEIGRIKPANDKTIRALVGLIQHEDWQTRLNAIKGLGLIGAPAKDLAVDPLLAIANSMKEIETVRTEAKRAVKIINPRRTFQD